MKLASVLCLAWLIASFTPGQLQAQVGSGRSSQAQTGVACPSDRVSAGRIEAVAPNAQVLIERDGVRLRAVAGAAICNGDRVFAVNGDVRARARGAPTSFQIRSGYDWRPPPRGSWFIDVISDLEALRAFFFAEGGRTRTAATLNSPWSASDGGMAFMVAGLETHQAVLMPGRRNLAIGIVAKPLHDYLVVLTDPKGRTQRAVLPYDQSVVRFPDFSGEVGAWAIRVVGGGSVLEGGFSVTPSAEPAGWNEKRRLIEALGPTDAALAYACLDVLRGSFEALQRIAASAVSQDERLAKAEVLQLWRTPPPEGRCNY